MEGVFHNSISNYFSYEKYIKLVNKYLDTDNREINYQNRIIIPFLEKMFADSPYVDIVDVSTLYKNWEKREGLDRSKYAGHYTPDILVVEKWKLFNEGKDINYYALIEVKTPNASDRTHADNEVKEYCDKTDIVILTDCVTWEFYQKGELISEYFLEIDERKVCKRGQSNKIINWKNTNKDRSTLPVGKVASNDSNILEPREWKSLCTAISKIVSKP